MNEAKRSEVRTSFDKQTLMQTIGATLDEVESGRVVISMPTRPDLCQQHGFLHAAILTAIVDTACGYAALSQMPDNSDVLTVEFKTNFLRPALGKTFYAVANVVRAGKTISVATGEVRADDAENGKVIALMTATLMRVEVRMEENADV